MITGTVWQLLQSDKIASMISKEITKDITKIFNADFKFKKMEIKLFPPATVLKQVRIIGKGKKKGRIVKANVGSFGIYFGLLDIFSSEATIGKIKIEDGELLTFSSKDISTTKKNNKNEQVKISSLFEKYQEDFMDEAPINLKMIEMSKIDLNIDGNEFLIEKCSLKLFRDKLILNLNTENINLEKRLGKISILNGKGVEVDALLKKNQLTIREFKVRDKLDIYGYQGKVYEKNNQIILDGKSSYHGGVTNMIDLTGMKLYMHGLVDADFKIDGNIEDLKVAYSMNIRDFESEWGNFEKIKLKGEKRKNYLLLDSLKIEDQDSIAESLSESTLYNFQSKKILENGIKLNMKNFFSNKALYVVKDDLQMLKGYFTGEVVASYINDVISFNFKKGFKIDDFRLVNDSNQETPIISHPTVKIERGGVDIPDKGPVGIDFKLLLKDTVFQLKGKIGKKKVMIESKEDPINLESFGPISGVALKGKGKLKLKISGNYPNINFFFNSLLEDSYVPGYNLGKLRSLLVYDLRKDILKIYKMKGVNGASYYQGDGYLNFDNKDILLNIAFNNSYYTNLFEIYENIFSHPNIPRDASLLYNASYKVTGKMEKDKIKVKGKINGRELLYKDEEIDSFRGDFFYGNNKLVFKNGIFKKNKGLVNFSSVYDFSNKSFDYDVAFKNVQLKDINIYEKMKFGYDADMHGYLKGHIAKETSIKSEIKFTRGNIGNIVTSDSFLAVSSAGSDIYTRGNFLGDIVNFDSRFDLSKRKKSYINASVMADDIKLLAGFLSSHNIDNKFLKGLLSARLKTSFKWDDLSSLALAFSLDEFQLKKNKIHLIGNNKNKILIKKGIIKNWDVSLRGENGRIVSNGSGNLSQRYNLITDFSLNASLFELISPMIQKAEGDINGKYLLKGDGKDFSSHFTSNGKIDSLKIEKIPKFFSDVNYRMMIDNNDLALQRLKGEYGKGSIDMNGNILFLPPFAKVDLNFTLNNSFIPLIKKSGVIVSGNGEITGKRFPYLISGDFSILHGSIIDEFEDIFSANKEQIEHSRYIPEKALEKNKSYFMNDLQVQFVGPVGLKNRHAELQFDGEMKIRGSPGNPFFNGFLKVIPTVSKFTFKGHDFSLKKGRVDFQDENKKEPANIDFSGESKINEYVVGLDLRGKTKELDFLLKSEPPLSQQDILSLLTLGVTSEKKDKLDESDKQSIISVGLGSLLADQLKLGKDLNSSLGIRFSILPELGEDKSSKVQGRATNKLKSSTKIKLEKKLTEKVDLSVSSTVGGSLEQKQEVNIKLNLNDNLSVQGVYESRSSNEDEEETEASDSIGFDFIFKRTYK